MEAKMKIIDVQEFIRRFKNLIENEHAQFCFFLGAGCSVTSGIPTAGTLVKEWLPKLQEMKTGNQENFNDWLKKEFPKYEENRAAQFYGEVIESLFPSPKERQTEIERLVKYWYPGFGYAVLAKLIEKKGVHCNIILTTNFDDMVADALYLYTNKKPIVIFHEALASFVKISDTRPIIIKLHGDSKLSPRNTKDETEKLNDEVKKAIKNLFSETGLIFIGYGGNDSSIIELLNEIPENDGSFQWGIYWIGENVTNENMKKFLEKRNALWVRHKGFDELMLLLKEALDLEMPTKDKFVSLFEDLNSTLNNLTDVIHAKPDSVEKELLEEAARKTSKELMISMNPEFTEFKLPSLDNKFLTLSQIMAESLGNFKTFSQVMEESLGNVKTFSQVIAESLGNIKTPSQVIAESLANIQTPLIDPKILHLLSQVKVESFKSNYQNPLIDPKIVKYNKTK